MHDIGFDLPLQDWFDFKIPKTQIKRNFIESCIESEDNNIVKPSQKIIWIGNYPLIGEFEKSKKGKTKSFLEFTFHTKTHSFDIEMEKEVGEWFLSILDDLAPTNEKLLSVADMKLRYKSHFGDFELFWHSKSIYTLRENGLLVL